MENIEIINMKNEIRNAVIEHPTVIERGGNVTEHIRHRTLISNDLCPTISHPVVFLHGSPLRRDLAFLDNKKEEGILWKCIQDSKRNINFKSVRATSGKFHSALLSMPRILHFSGFFSHIS